MIARHELGVNIIHNPEAASNARVRDLKKHLYCGYRALKQIPDNLSGGLSGKAVQAQRKIQKARLSELRCQIDGKPLTARSHVYPEPLNIREARLKDLLLHRRAIRAGVRKAEKEGDNEDHDEFLKRIDEVQEVLNKEYPV